MLTRPKKGIPSDWYVMGKHKQNFHQHLVHNFLDTRLPWYSQEFPRLSATMSTEGLTCWLSPSSLSFKSDMTLSISMNETVNGPSLEDCRVWILQDCTIMPMSVSFAFGHLICLTNLRAHTEAATSPVAPQMGVLWWVSYSSMFDITLCWTFSWQVLLIS